MARYTKLVESEPGLMAASLAIHIQYKGLLAAFLIAGNFTIVRHLLNRGELHNYVRTALYIVDFCNSEIPAAINCGARSKTSLEGGQSWPQPPF